MRLALEQLRDALMVLAAPAQDQLAYLARLELPAGVDEIALEYDDVAEAADDMFEQGELNKEQMQCVKSRDQFISSFSGQDNATPMDS
jgi:hypothetical protein